MTPEEIGEMYCGMAGCWVGDAESRHNPNTCSMVEAIRAAFETEREANCKLVCADCDADFPVERGDNLGKPWWHQHDNDQAEWRCDAWRIRERSDQAWKNDKVNT